MKLSNITHTHTSNSRSSVSVSLESRYFANGHASQDIRETTHFIGCTPVRRPLCRKPARKNRTNLMIMLINYRSLATFLSLTVEAHVHSVMHGQLWKQQRMYVRLAALKSHFNLNQAFKVIQGHPYCCRQESRTVCCRNVQLMPE